MKSSIIITTYGRPKQLYACLCSLARQDLASLDLEVVVVNDGPEDESHLVCTESDAAKKLQVRYVHSGVRNGPSWRCMGFAANIGVRQARGDIVVLTNSDIYHVGDTVSPVVKGCLEDPLALSTVSKIYDDDGSLIQHLSSHPNDATGRDEIIRRLRSLDSLSGTYAKNPANPDMPFLMAVRRDILLKIGGYDEDFIGVAAEDNDLIDRLLQSGCHYRYADNGSEAIHLYHARKTKAQLEEEPGYAYNVDLWKQRRGKIVRNEGRDWGKLICQDSPQRSAPVHLTLWVTSQCNLGCQHCNQQAAIESMPDYEMSMQELDDIIASCQERGIHFSTVELTGGEPSLWSLFEEGMTKLAESGIVDEVTFITNGNDASNVARIANSLGVRYAVSRSQATLGQSAVHQKTGVGVMWNDHAHRALPSQPLPGTLPALCSQRQDRNGRIVRQLSYVRGKVYYCCMALANSLRLGIREDPKLWCSFRESFTEYFDDRKFDLPICSICLCNEKVWCQFC